MQLKQSSGKLVQVTHLSHDWFSFDSVLDWLGDQVAQMTTLDSFRSAAVFLSCYCFIIAIVAAVIVVGPEASGSFKVVLYFGFPELMRHVSHPKIESPQNGGS